MPFPETAEHQRLVASETRLADWKKWGPYVSERQWGTVREDYSATGEAWDSFPHDHARSRAYRWGEDGIGGFCDRRQTVCLGVALWNGRDPILKERLFGLTGSEGNHGEDVKEYYFYLDATPTHSYNKMLYKYPQAAFPYADLVHENGRRGKHDPEFELVDALPQTYAENRLFDVFIEYAKAGQTDILCRITAVNRGPDPAPIHILPHVWFRNTWSWDPAQPKPQLTAIDHNTIHLSHATFGERWWHVSVPDQPDTPPLLFTENETNTERLFGLPNATPYVKDGIDQAVVAGDMTRVNPALTGTKAAAHATAVVAPGAAFSVYVRLTDDRHGKPFEEFTAVFEQRIAEADAFYDAIQPAVLDADARLVQRQAFAGLLWTKQFYYFNVNEWLNGDPAGPPPPEARKHGRNCDWTHLDNFDVISMPDKWEYPWYAAWDLAFHTLPITILDPELAKRQLVLMLREWYMHPNGQIPAYEWAFGDVNPPVHAWAVMRVYEIERALYGRGDTSFLERTFHKLLLNFTWWVNRKDADGNNVFQGGFLGLDNIGVFDRSQPLPDGAHLDQADGTAWMAMYSLNMLAIALELARERPAYEDVATKFFEHFIYIADAINRDNELGGLWDEQDGFFYDRIHSDEGWSVPMRIRSFVGLIPLFAVQTIEPEILEKLPRFRQRMSWFIKERPYLVNNIASLRERGHDDRLLLSLVSRTQLQRILTRMFDPAQFLSDYGLRSLSKEHEARPFQVTVHGNTLSIDYEPAESTTTLFGGNSNWRGPIWFPVNYLMIEALHEFDRYYADTLKVELPVGSGDSVTLAEAADRVSSRLCDLFARDGGGKRPFYGGVDLFQQHPDWRDYILFYEYFHGDNGAGIGASHQTGWTALVAALLELRARDA